MLKSYLRHTLTHEIFHPVDFTLCKVYEPTPLFHRKYLITYHIIKNEWFCQQLFILILILFTIQKIYACNFKINDFIYIIDIHSLQGASAFRRNISSIFYHSTKAIPKALQDSTASLSGKSLQITLSETRKAPLSSQVFSQFLIHSPSPQP